MAIHIVLLIVTLACVLGKLGSAAKQGIGSSSKWSELEGSVKKQGVGSSSKWSELEGIGSVGPLKWSNCGNAETKLNITYLVVSPDSPIELGKNASVSAGVALTESVTDFSVQLKLEREVFGVFVEIPCVDNIGSCTYKNLCSKIPNDPCPPLLKKYGIPCHCPFAAGKYGLPPTDVTLPDPPKDVDWLSNGNYKVTAKGSDQSGNSLFCFQVQLSLKAN